MSDDGLVPVFVTTGIRTSGGSGPGVVHVPPDEAGRIVADHHGVPGTVAPRGYALVYIADRRRDSVLTIELRLAAELQRPDVQLDELYHGLSQAMSEHFHIVHCANGVQRASELTLETLRALQIEHCLACGARPEDHQESGHNLWMRWL